MENYYDNREYHSQVLLNKQELMNSTVYYNKVVEACISTMNKYVNSLSKNEKNSKSKGDFLFQLECLNSMVKQWNVSFPGIEPKLKKNINKNQLIANLKNLAKQANSAHSYEEKNYFEKFISLLENNNKVEYFGQKKIMSNFQDNHQQPTEEKTLYMANRIIDKNVKLNEYVEEQKANNYKDYDMDY